MKKQPEGTDIALHIMQLKTDYVEYIGDEACYGLASHIPNGDYKTRNHFDLRLNESTATLPALRSGGIAVWSNLKPQTLRRSILVGLEMMFRSGQMDVDDFVEGAFSDETGE